LIDASNWLGRKLGPFLRRRDPASLYGIDVPELVCVHVDARFGMDFCLLDLHTIGDQKALNDLSELAAS
jgi:hypothetical protein